MTRSYPKIFIQFVLNGLGDSSKSSPGDFNVKPTLRASELQEQCRKLLEQGPMGACVWGGRDLGPVCRFREVGSFQEIKPKVIKE